ncbi:pirin family protein [Myroides sp. M-43]|uniref:pirin family protein n=1 Tax=Myroides oncorhynchi TaxID=2893756 RepID=UPI001E41BCD3|nr:pirin family protein [Myroides oncorhynchi]MCC9042534.1 pirin family protein [Myroides oncorhynchi]
MNTKILYTADSRGYANHGWLKSHHTFSFANYRNNDRVHFGVLRVLNDDNVAAGMGFGTHPHDNMEIISIPLSGSLSHKDSMGNGTIINEGEIQIMSAGTGVQHSEFNPNENQESQFLQIWIFPDKLNVKPRYDQLKLNKEDRANQWDQILSPNPDDKGVWIHQNAWFHMADLEQGKELSYELKDKSNGVFMFILEGDITLGSDVLHRRDAIGFDGEDTFTIKANENSQVLLMEIPMELPSYLQ